MRDIRTQAVWEALEAPAFPSHDAHLVAASQLTAEAATLLATEIAADLDAGADDTRLVDVLAYIASRRETDSTALAYQALERQVANAASRGHAPTLAQARAARALWKAGKDPRAFDILNKLAAIDSTAAVEESVAGLIEVAQPTNTTTRPALDRVVDIIERSLSNKTQVTAILPLLSHLELDQWDRIPTGLVWFLRGMVASAFPSVRAAAGRELRSLIQQRLAGADDSTLGVVATQRPFSPPLTALTGRLTQPSQPFDLDALDTLVDGERRFALDLLVAALERNDPRAEDALARLGGDMANFALADYRAGRRLTRTA